MAVTYVSHGSPVSAIVGSLTPAPLNNAAGQLLLLLVETQGNAPATPSGWTAGPTQDNGLTGVSGCGLYVFYRIATGTDPCSVATGGLHMMALILTFDGVNVASPIDTSGTKFLDASAVTSHNFSNITTTVNGAMGVLLAATNVNVGTNNISQTSTSLTGFTNLGRIGFSSGTGSDKGTIGVGYGIQATAGSVTGTHTATFGVSTNTAGIFLALRQAPIAHAVSAVTGTLTPAGGDISVKNKDGVALAGVLGSVTGAMVVDTRKKISIGAALLQKVTGTVAMKNKDGVAINAALLQKVTGAVALANKDGIALAGVLSSITGTAAVANKDGVTLAGVLGFVTAAVTATTTDQLALTGTLGAVVGDIDLQNKDGVVLVGVLGSVSGSMDLTHGLIEVAAVLGPIEGLIVTANKNGITLMDGLLGSVEGDIITQNKDGITLAGVLGSVEGALALDIQAACYDVQADKRELILRRVLALLGGVMGAKRNDVSIPDSVLPLAVLLDGDETVKQDTFERGRPASGPNIITASPEMYLTFVVGEVEDAGPAAADMEATIKALVLGDPVLALLCHSMRYTGNDTATAFGRSIYVQMQFDFEFDYVLTIAPPCAEQDVEVDPDAQVREQILAAVMSLAGQTEGVLSTSRNDNTIPDDPELMPRVLMFDGSEDTDPRAWGKGRPANAPGRMLMHPELYVILPEEEGESAGSHLNRIRLMLLRGVLTDPVLADLVLDGDIRYEGCQTAMAAGRTLTGEMGIALSIMRRG